MLRTFAHILAAVFGVIAVATVLRISSGGLGVLYLGTAAVFSYAGFSRRDTAIIRTIVAAIGSFFLISGLLVALTMSILGFPFEGRFWVVGLAHAAFGGLTMACAVVLPCDD